MKLDGVAGVALIGEGEAGGMMIGLLLDDLWADVCEEDLMGVLWGRELTAIGVTVSGFPMEVPGLGKDGI